MWFILYLPYMHSICYESCWIWQACIGSRGTASPFILPCIILCDNPHEYKSPLSEEKLQDDKLTKDCCSPLDPHGPVEQWRSTQPVLWQAQTKCAIGQLAVGGWATSATEWRANLKHYFKKGKKKHEIKADPSNEIYNVPALGLWFGCFI